MVCLCVLVCACACCLMRLCALRLVYGAMLYAAFVWCVACVSVCVYVNGVCVFCL